MQLSKCGAERRPALRTLRASAEFLRGIQALGSSPTAPKERLGTLGAPRRERSEKEGWRLELRKMSFMPGP